MMVEIKNFPTYWIEANGKIRSWHNKNAKDIGYIMSDGYRGVSLRRDGKTYTFRIARLVLENFAGPCPEGKQACHKNSIKTDDRLDNLYWGTPVENQHDKIAAGTTNRGGRNGQSVLTFTDVSEIRTLLDKIPRREIAERFQVSTATITDIALRRTWGWMD